MCKTVLSSLYFFLLQLFAAWTAVFTAFATRENADAIPAGRELDATSFLAILVARSMDSVATAPASAPRDGMDDTAPYVSYLFYYNTS